jgi:hypothetical protein
MHKKERRKERNKDADSVMKEYEKRKDGGNKDRKEKENRVKLCVSPTSGFWSTCIHSNADQ